MQTTRKRSTEEASAYLWERHGVRRSKKTLDRYRCVGGGPKFYKAGSSPRARVSYSDPHLDEYAAEILGEPCANTAEHAQRRRQRAATTEQLTA